MTATPIYTAVIAETGIVPEQSYARCSSLVTFTFSAPPVRRVASSTPKVGVKPARKKIKR